MHRGFWSTLPRPFVALAPMANVTDAAFRRIIARYGKPDVLWTEFVSCDGLCSPGRERVMPDLWFTESERPIVAQTFGATAERMRRCGEFVRELGFDGLDINMGCPDRAVERQGAGAALIKNPDLAVALIRAAQEGAAPLPVSVKTRIGYTHNTLTEWLPRLLEAEPAAIIIHARTRDEMSRVPARWESVAQAVEIVHREFPRNNRPLVVGNGDVSHITEAAARARETGADGIMIGRGVFGNPWFFARNKLRDPASPEERLRVMVEHTRLFEDLFGGNPVTGKRVKNFDVMKKHYGAYVSGFPGAKELRAKLMACASAGEVAQIVQARYAHDVANEERSA